MNAIKAREAEIEAAAARRAVLTPTRSATRRGSPQKTTFAGGRVAVVTLPLVRNWRCIVVMSSTSQVGPALGPEESVGILSRFRALK